MSSYYLEQLRSTLGSVELIEKTVITCLFGRQQTPKQSVLLEHRVNNLLQMAQTYAQEALTLVDGADGSKKEEVDYLQGVGKKDGDVWDNFYERFKEIKDYHRRVAQGQMQLQVAGNTKIEYFYEQAFAPPFSEPFFSGEEQYGRYLDLHANFQEFLNLKKIKESDEYKMGDYLWYLQNFDLFHEIPAHLKEKQGKKYKKYLSNLLNYLKNFYMRINPLTGVEKVQNSFEVDFQRQWQSGIVKGWEKSTSSVNEIQNNRLYCFVCTKLFQNENTFVNHYQGKRHKKLAKLKEKEDVLKSNGNHQIEEKDQFHQEDEEEEEKVDITVKFRKNLAKLECLVQSYKENMTAIVNDTMNLIRKKQSRSYDDQDDENENGEANDQGWWVFKNIILDKNNQDSDSDSPVYNPKNLPLGWDGRPIPYWLYKLHGLGVEYKCEICGNTSYWGRKAFEDHFQGWRHSYGMKCLRIPNTMHFKEVTKIQDAIDLYKKIQYESSTAKFKPEYEEEYEDTDGNLLNKKTYYDLKKQGLL